MLADATRHRTKKERRLLQALMDWPLQARRGLVGVMTDIDDTLTTDGAITADALQALHTLHAAGLHSVHDQLRPGAGARELPRKLRLAGQQGIEVPIGLGDEDGVDRDAQQDQHHREDRQHGSGHTEPERDSVQPVSRCLGRWICVNHAVVPSR